MTEKAQQLPHCPWSLTGVTVPFFLQSTVSGRGTGDSPGIMYCKYEPFDILKVVFTKWVNNDFRKKAIGSYLGPISRGAGGSLVAVHHGCELLVGEVAELVHLEAEGVLAPEELLVVPLDHGGVVHPDVQPVHLLKAI